MRRYYYIPYIFTQAIQGWQAIWLSKSPDAYICIVGVYTQIPFQESEATPILLQNGENIMRVFTDDLTRNTYELVGYCLEALVSQVPNPLPPSVLIFESAEFFLTWKLENRYL